jgi:hypothetical protein
MALLSVKGGCTGTVRRGDVVFDTQEHELGYPVHVGVMLGDKCPLVGTTTLDVQGLLPIAPKQAPLGTASWGSAGQYQPDLIGQRLDVDEVLVNEVALLAISVQHEGSQLPGGVRWKKSRKIDTTVPMRDGVGLFLRGTCSHYVAYLYESVGIGLVSSATTFDPKDQERAYPTAQMHALFVGTYPLDCAWDSRFAEWPGCIFGEPTRNR